MLSTLVAGVAVTGAGEDDNRVGFNVCEFKLEIVRQFMDFSYFLKLSKNLLFFKNKYSCSK